MRLKILAISDTHLGEDTSLLSFPQGRQHLWNILQKEFSSDGPIEVDDLVLVGDIPDRTLSSTSQIVTQTNAFTRMLGSVCRVKKTVYIPGNHDHTLWTNYRSIRYGDNDKYGITGPTGDVLVKNGVRCDDKESGTELLTLFFGYPQGSSWRNIAHNKEDFEFAIANPLYCRKINGRSYVFTHGTHFKEIVTLPKWIKQIADVLEIDEILGKIEIKSECDVTKADSLESLEEIVSPFVDSLWPSSKDNPTSRSDQFWYLLTTLSHKLGKKRPAPDKSELITWSELLQGSKKGIEQLTSNGKIRHDSLKRWQEYFLPHMTNFLQDQGLLQNDMTFIFGDTHDGGWGELTLESGINIRIYNCGGWVVHNAKDHPACHLFVLKDNGEECILKVSYKDVTVEEDPLKTLLKLAAEDSENRQRNTSRIFRFLLKMMFG